MYVLHRAMPHAHTAAASPVRPTVKTTSRQKCRPRNASGTSIRRSTARQPRRATPRAPVCARQTNPRTPGMSAHSAPSPAPGARMSVLRALSSFGALSGLSGLGGPGGAAGRRAKKEHLTGPALRAFLAAQPAWSKRRLVRDDAGAALRFMATRAGGDCGFEAVSWALAVARGHGPDAAQVRAALRAHVAAERAGYARACGAGDRQVDDFLDSVLRPGIRGHWLGQTWGALELVAVARALRVTVRVYAWDAARQAVRAYFEEPAGQDVVRLLFTGHADRGHFDVLAEERPRVGWVRLWRRRVGKKVAMCEMERGFL